MLFNAVLLIFPVIFLVLSVVLVTKAVNRGKSPKRSVITQLCSFAGVLALCIICPIAVSAVNDPNAAGAAVQDLKPIAEGLKYIAAGFSTGLSCIGGGIAVGKGASAAIGAAAEDQKNFGKAIIFVALGEGIALYGMLISILILNG